MEAGTDLKAAGIGVFCGKGDVASGLEGFGRITEDIVKSDGVLSCKRRLNLNVEAGLGRERGDLDVGFGLGEFMV